MKTHFGSFKSIHINIPVPRRLFLLLLISPLAPFCTVSHVWNSTSICYTQNISIYCVLRYVPNVYRDRRAWLYRLGTARLALTCLRSSCAGAKSMNNSTERTVLETLHALHKFSSPHSSSLIIQLSLIWNMKFSGGFALNDSRSSVLLYSLRNNQYCAWLPEEVLPLAFF